ncbi:MAG: hypothetical protein ACOYM2_18655 [Rectinemataceae bacterium]
MGQAFESIMRGLSEAKAHLEGRLSLKTSAIAIAPPQGDATTAERSGDQVYATPESRNIDRQGY